MRVHGERLSARAFPTWTVRCPTADDQARREPAHAAGTGERPPGTQVRHSGSVVHAQATALGWAPQPFGAEQPEESKMQRRDVNAPDAYLPVASYTQAIEV